MSPPWRDEVAIYLAPHKVALARSAVRGLRRRVVAATERAVPVATAGDLGPVLAHLADLLTEPTWQGAAARAVVADHRWARYAVVPWPATRLDEAGRLALARCALADVHGQAVAEWAVTLADAPPGRPAVACAMPAMLRSVLEDELAPARLTLVSLQPRLIVAFNAWRHRLPADEAWFVSVDDRTLSAVHLGRGAWDQVHLARLPADWTVELERLRAFGRLTRAAAPPPRVWVDAPAAMRRGIAEAADLEWLEEEPADGGQAHELALLRRACA